MFRRYLAGLTIVILLAAFCVPSIALASIKPSQPQLPIRSFTTTNTTISLTGGFVSCTINSPDDQSWANARGAASGEFTYDPTHSLIGGAIYGQNVASTYKIMRSLLAFDLATNNITDLDSILSVTVKIVQTADDNTWTNGTNAAFSLYVLNSEPTNGYGGNMHANDFGKMVPTTRVTTELVTHDEYADSSTISFPITQEYWDETLLVAEGWAYFVCADENYDHNNSAPGWEGVSSYHRWYGSNNVAVKLEIITTDEFPPTVVTNSVSALTLTKTTATLSGNITSLGNLDVTTRGFVWGAYSQAEPADNITPASSNYTYYWTATGNFTVGNFTHDISNLSENSTYYARACAYNSEGWGYGDEITFNTWHEIMLFQPITMIIGTNLPDESGHGYNGTFNWGANPAGANTTPGGFTTPGTNQSPPWTIYGSPGGTLPSSNTTGFLPESSANGTAHPGSVNASYPGHEIIDDIASAGSIPNQLPQIIIATFLIIMLDFGLVYFMRKYQAQGRIFFQYGLIAAAFGLAITFGVYDFWMIVAMFIYGAAIGFAAKVYG